MRIYGTGFDANKNNNFAYLDTLGGV